MIRDTPHPFPSRLTSQVNSDMRQARILDSNARFIVRRLIADAYAEGFDDGIGTASQNEWADRQATEDLEEES